MQVIDQRTIYRGMPASATASACFPSLVRLADGSQLVSWRVGTDKDSADGRILLSRSADVGLTWSEPDVMTFGPYSSQPREPHYAPLTALADGRILAAVMWVDRSNPSLPFFHPTTEGLLPTTVLFCESPDAGRTWEKFREMDRAPYHSPVPVTGPVLQLADGALACQFEVNKNYNDPRPWRHAAAWKISRDGGFSWPESIEIANDPANQLMYWDARYTLGLNGLCLATFWTYNHAEGRDAPIHLSISHDYGQHWTPPHDTKIVGQVAQPVLLKDERLALIYVERFNTRSIRALLSDDLGKTFHSETVVFKHSEVQPVPSGGSAATDYLQDMNTWTFGRVDALADSPGYISAVFYAGNRDATNIYWSRLKV